MERLGPKPTRLHKAHIDGFAERLAGRLDFDYNDPIDPLVSKLGGKVEYKNADASTEEQPESIVVFSSKEFVIYLPTVTSAVRDRFTIAHELGHFFLHYPLVAAGRTDVVMVATRWVDEKNEALRRAEWEANWFAAGFLMPSKKFRVIFETLDKDIAAVAIKFQLSPKAVEIRALSLGLI